MSKKTEALEVILGLMPNAKFIDKNGKDVTEDVKKSHNVANNVAQRNSQDLTELWKKGELEQGWYYVKNEFGNIFISEYSKDYDFIGERVISGFFTEVSEIIEIICEVPSYEEWQELSKQRNQLIRDVKDLAYIQEENDKLKELLKNVTDEYDIEKQKALLKINELSGLLKECREWIEFMEEKSRADENYKGTMYFKNLLTKINEVLK